MSDRSAAWLCRPGSHPVASLASHRTATGKLRWLATLSPEAAGEYATAVASVVSSAERRLGPEVMADRVRSGPSVGPPVLRLAPWQRARARWRASAVRGLEGTTRALVVTDVRDCFASVSADTVRRALREAGAPGPAVERVVACLHAFAEEGIVGLPVGPAASAVLANVTLAGLDEALRRRGTRHLRWVDDVVAFAPSKADALLLLGELHRASERIGLELHGEKTRLVDDPAEARSILGASNSPGAAAGMA